MKLMVLLVLTLIASGVKADDSRRELMIRSGDADLHTVVTLPENRDSPMPVVVFLVGSSDGSTVQNYRQFVDFYLRQPLQPHGFAIAVFDKPGLGKSSGSWHDADFFQRARDAAAVGEYLQQQPWVDSRRVYAIGHSQGGWIAQLAVAQYPQIFAAGVSMAGPTFSVREQLLNDFASDYECDDGLSQSEAYDRAEKAVTWTLRIANWFTVTDTLKQLDVIKDFSPRAYLPRVNNPLLLMFAENDRLVDPQLSLAALNDIFGPILPAHIHTYVAAAQNHAFKIADKCSPNNTNHKYSAATRYFILHWLLSLNHDL